MTRLRLTFVFVFVIGCPSPETVEPTNVSSTGADEVAAPQDTQASLALPLRRDVASTVSAPGVVRFVSNAVAVVGLVVGAFRMAQNAGEPLPACPRVTGNEERGMIEGGCTDENGERVEGRVSFDTSGDIATYRFDGFQLNEFRIDGTVRARSSRRPSTGVQPHAAAQPANEDWWIDIEAYAPLNNDYRAALQRAADEEPEPEEVYLPIRIDYEASLRDKTYEGRGSFAIGDFGTFRAETHAEVVDNDVCNSEAASGETILSTDDDRVRIIYDGATDCDPTSTVIVQRGEQRQELAGVQCSANGRAPSAWPLLALLLIGRRC